MAQGKNGYFFGTLGDQEYNSDNRRTVIKGDASKSSDVIIIMENEIGGPNNIKNGEKKNEYIEKRENGLTVKYTYENEGRDLKITWDYKKPEEKKEAEKKEKVGDDTTKKINDSAETKFKLIGKSKDKLQTCDKRLIKLFEVAIDDKRCPFDIFITEGHRNKEDQNKAYSEGKSKLKWPNGKHNKLPSLAVDAIPFPVDWNDIDRFNKLGNFILTIAKEQKIMIEWGGNWKKKSTDIIGWDAPHYEIKG